MGKNPSCPFFLHKKAKLTVLDVNIIKAKKKIIL